MPSCSQKRRNAQNRRLQSDFTIAPNVMPESVEAAIVERAEAAIAAKTLRHKVKYNKLSDPHDHVEAQPRSSKFAFGPPQHPAWIQQISEKAASLLLQGDNPPSIQIPDANHDADESPVDIRGIDVP